MEDTNKDDSFILADIALLLGARSSGRTLQDFMDALTTTPEGLIFLCLGIAIEALVPLSVTLATFPLLLDRDVDLVTAMTTS
jgi:uncharacterized membrane protein